MLGDFNISELPARNLLRPVEVPAHERYQFQPTFWKQLFRPLVEICTPSTTHRCYANNAESSIDRVFTSFQAHNLTH
eukprot:2434301-Pyramimonas_sp.AAC.1